VRLVNFGHLGDGNLHYNVQAPVGVDAQAFMREREDEVNTLVFDAVQRFGGSISAEHGVGTLKVSKLEQHKSPVALGLMRSIKTALDPHKLMNPGKLLRRSCALRSLSSLFPCSHDTNHPPSALPVRRLHAPC
jgi:FAD/FMN-containing dehydrogenase